MNSPARRLEALEHIYSAPPCPVCLGRPSRVVTIDPVTNQEISESMPEAGCAACGTAIFREYVIVDDDVPLRPVP